MDSQSKAKVSESLLLAIRYPDGSFAGSPATERTSNVNRAGTYRDGTEANAMARRLGNGAKVCQLTYTAKGGAKVDDTTEATIASIVKIAEKSGFDLEDDTSGVDLRFGYRDDNDVGGDEPSLASRQLARHVRREILAAFPTAIVEGECIDEWVSLLVKLPPKV